jgi:hypothetical protein
MKRILLLLCSLGWGVGYGQVDQVDAMALLRKSERSPLKGIVGLSVSAFVIDPRKGQDEWEKLGKGTRYYAVTLLRQLEVTVLEPLNDRRHDERGSLVISYVVDRVEKGGELYSCTFRVRALAFMKSPRTDEISFIPVWEETKVTYLSMGDDVTLEPLTDLLKDFVISYTKAQSDK